MHACCCQDVVEALIQLGYTPVENYIDLLDRMTAVEVSDA
jgi:hypothetical protein